MSVSHIVIVGDLFTFPEGHAATSRIFAYAKGFMEQGIRIEVISLINEYNAGQGIYEEIPYYYPLNQPKKNPAFIIRNFFKVKKYYNHFRLLLELNKAKPVDVVILYSESALILSMQYLFKLLTRGLLIFDLNEIYFNNQPFTGFPQLIRKAFAFLVSHFCDGYVAISSYLRDYAIRDCGSEKRVLLVPAMVDFERFQGDSVHQPPIPVPYILQSGTLNCHRDRIDTLIRAMALLAASFPQLKLVLTGRFIPKEDKPVILQLIRELGLEEKVVIQESIPRTEIPRYLANAAALVISRSQTEETKASFPTKLPEYLASGNPVVVSDVGTISSYLEDNVSAFFVPPDDAACLAEKLQFVLGHSDLARQVGQTGQQVARQQFDNNAQCKIIVGFFNRLSSANDQ